MPIYMFEKQYIYIYVYVYSDINVWWYRFVDVCSINISINTQTRTLLAKPTLNTHNYTLRRKIFHGPLPKYCLHSKVTKKASGTITK